MKFSHTHTKALHDKYEAEGAKAVQLFEFALLTLQVKALAGLLRDSGHARKIAQTFAAVGAFTMNALSYTTEEFDPVMQATEAAVLADTKDSISQNGEGLTVGVDGKDARII